MAAESMDHMAAGIDTTGDGLCFLMHELSLPRSQQIQQKLREELVQNPQSKLDELPYLDAVIKEGLRLFPPIPMSLPRYVPENGRTVCGYTLPAGSIVSCQAYSLHLLDKDVFPNAEKFLPDRWLQKEGEIERNRLFFAFASGGRGCIGKKYVICCNHVTRTELTIVQQSCSRRDEDSLARDLLTVHDQGFCGHDGRYGY